MFTLEIPTNIIFNDSLNQLEEEASKLWQKAIIVCGNKNPNRSKLWGIFNVRDPPFNVAHKQVHLSKQWGIPNK